MIVSQVRLREVGDGVELSANVRYENPPHDRDAVWFRVPIEHAVCEPLGDAYFAGLLVPCMILGERLTIEAAVSPELVKAAHQQVMPIMTRWFAELAEPEISCETPSATQRHANKPPLAPRSATFFPGGVDSWYTARKHLESLSALVLIHGFEIPLDNERRWRMALEHVRRTAADPLGLELVTLSTNLLDIAGRATMVRLAKAGRPSPFFMSAHLLGAYLVAVGLTLRRHFD